MARIHDLQGDRDPGAGLSDAMRGGGDHRGSASLAAEGGQPMARREFCLLATLGVLGVAASGVLGCGPTFSGVSTTTEAAGSATATPAPVSGGGVIANTDTTLELPGTNVSGLHPSFIDFLTEHGLHSWGGYRYWLSWTPYDSLAAELPAIAASNDLVTWVTPLGLPHPLTKTLPNGKGSVAVCNDPEICYDPDANCINLYHGVYNGGTLFPDRTNGSHWGGGLFCYRIQEDGTIDGKLFDQGPPFTSCVILGLTGGSVSVHRESTGKWHMWESAFSYRTSRDGLKWSAGAPCTVGTPITFRSRTLPRYMKGWRLDHAGGEYNPANGRMEFAVSCIPKGRAGGQDENLAMVVCSLSEPTALYVMLDEWLLMHRRPTSDWDGGSIYRSVLMPHPTDPSKRRLIYSAFREPVTDLPTANKISTLVEGDISGHLLAKRLPKQG